jgi:hypothetical protein
MTEIDAGLLKQAVCDLTTVEIIPQGFEITLPQMYHTGQAVAVVVAQYQDGFIVHDNSYAAMLLSGLGLRPGKRLADALLPQIGAYGCELNDLRVVRRCKTFGEVAFAMAAVGCASRLIADQALKADRPPLEDFKSSLLNRVIDAVGNARLRTNEEVSGHLGSKYRVSAVVLDSLLRRPVAFVEPIADREAIPRRFKQFYDLSVTPQYEHVERVAVYDEANPLPSGDALMMQEVGNLIRFADTTTRFRTWSTIQ